MESSSSITTPTSKILPKSELRRSIQLLDEALSPKGKSILRFGRTTPQRRLLGNRKRDDSYCSEDNIFDVGEVVKMKHNSSISLTSDGVSKILNESTATGLLVREQQAFSTVADKLFVEFLESFQTHGTEQQVFDVVADFIQTCTDTLEILRAMDDKIQSRGTSYTERQHWLELERNTWRLVYCLYQNRISSMLMEANEEMLADEAMELALPKLSEKLIVQRLYKEDNVVRECQLVIDWLEQNAADLLRDETSLQHFTDKTIAWENTLHQLQNKKEGIPYGSTRAIVSTLDPDAPLRQSKPLHDIDMEDENRLVKEVFVKIRCGALEQAQMLCKHTGQEWRAGTLEGWRPYHDPNYDKCTDDNEKQPVEGNPNRDIWKLMAWQLAEDKRMPLYTRATFGAFCGNLGVLTAVSQSWDDLLWAYLRVLVDIRVEQEIRAKSTQKYVDLPETYWQNQMELEEVFAAIASSKDPYIRLDSGKMMHKVQELLILDEISMLMDNMEQWIQEEHKAPHMLRFLSHLVLFLRLIGCLEKEDIGNMVLQSYVKVLMKMQDPQLVAHYVSTLPQEDQIVLYAEFLANITDSSERVKALNAADDAELDTEKITKTVVENIRNKESTSAITDLKEEITEEDKEKISALDWVVYYPTQRVEAIWQANALVRHFLALNKLEAARKAFNKIPVDSIEIIVRQNQPFPDISRTDALNLVQNLPYRIASPMREYLCYKAYLGAQESFADWFEHYHHAKPIGPKLPQGEVTFTERVAYDHRCNQYKSELDRWMMAMQQQTKNVKIRLYNVLTFPDGGWLGDSEMSNEEEENCMDSESELSRRLKQMEDLRQLCIPKITLLLHMVMHSMSEYTECVHLADLIVSERYKLYKVFTKVKLGELMNKICESSLALMNQKRDPWGHPVSS